MAEVTVTQPEPLDVQVELPGAPRVWFATDLGPKGDPGGLPPALLASRPVTAVPGQMFTATDTGDTYVWTGSTWLTVAKAKPSSLLSYRENVTVSTTVDTAHAFKMLAATVGTNVPVDGHVWRAEGFAYAIADPVNDDLEFAVVFSPNGGATTGGEYATTVKPRPIMGGLAAGWLPPARLVDTSGKSGSLCAAGALSYTGASTDPVDVNLTVAVIMTRL